MIYTITFNPAIDRLLFLEEMMESRKTNRIIDIAYDIGGKGTHGSYTISKLGVENRALGFMGGLNSSKFYKILEFKGIAHDFTLIKGQATRECYVVIDNSATGTTMLTEQGLTIPKEEFNLFFRKLETTVSQGDTVLIAGSLPGGIELSDLKKMINLLKDAGCFIACDLSGEALKLAINQGVDFIKPNEHELAELNNKDESPIEFLRELNKRVKYIVASLGKDGSYCFQDQEAYKVTPPKVNEVNDTGAGDCFVGAFLAGLYKQLNIEDTLRLASACAASKVMHSDSSTFSLEDLDNLKQQTKIAKL